VLISASPVTNVYATPSINFIGGDLSIGTYFPTTGQGAKPYINGSSGGWSSVAGPTADNWTGIDWASATPTGNFTPNSGTITTFGIGSQVSLVDIDFNNLPANLALGSGSGLYSGYTMIFSVNSVANKFKIGNTYGVDMYGLLSFDDGNNMTNDFTATPWVLSFSCPGCNTANQANQSWSINGSAIVPIPGTPTLLGLGLIGAFASIRRIRA
jgi:hypothetical protein